VIKSETIATLVAEDETLDATDHIFFATIDTRLTGQHAATNHVFLDSVQDFTQQERYAQVDVIKSETIATLVAEDETLDANELGEIDGFRFDHINLSVTLLFVGDTVSIAQAGFSQRSNVSPTNKSVTLRLM
jgi:hypothetical protein